MSNTRIIAMWSGPRNLSTAMMRSFENRPDTNVWDEPLYACYLARTQRPDPMAATIMQHGVTDWDACIQALCTPDPNELVYHKHITTHVLKSDSLTWLSQEPRMKHVFLIREPERVVASFNQLITNTDEDELVDYVGFTQQHRIFQTVCDQTDSTPLVIDSTRFLQDPSAHVKRLCEWLCIPFYDAMLSWPTGPRDSDGVWASHWYQSVEQSSGFGPAPAHLPALSDAQTQVAARCRPLYEAMLVHAI